MKRILALLVLLAPLFLSAQQEGNFVDWSAKRLDWDDFKASPVKNSDAAALTATHLGFSYSLSNNQVSYEIICRFDKTKSWGLVKTEWILKHEQGHFDIAEIFARKLKRELAEYQFNKKTFQKDLDAIYQRVIEEKEAFQLNYDTGTDYSRNKRKQLEWLKKIEEILEDTQSYSAYNSK
jgi:uncharacterized protein DUF922